METNNDNTAPGSDYLLRAPRVAVIGLDSAPAGLVLDQMADDLPNIRGLLRSGFGGVLKSCTPPITVPAWTCMFSGLDPGRVGLYGFRNRLDYSYDRLAVADASAVDVPRLWDHLDAAGRRSILIGVPQTYPPRPVNGLVVAGPLTPNKAAAYTSPRWLKARLDRWAGGEYHIDVKDFRTHDKNRLLGDLRAMARARFTLASRMLEEPWDLFTLVEMGTDRVQHAFWRYHDPTHRLYEPGHPFETVIRDYYQEMDGLVGGLIEKMPDHTLVLIVSDHGAGAMRGGVAVNEWLRRRGWLVLKDDAYSGPLEPERVDWSKTRVWGEGGYYGRLNFNVAGREPRGIVPPDQYAAFRGRVKAEVEAMADHQGNPLGNRALLPEDIYDQARGIPPDLMVLFGNLKWRSVGRVGTKAIHVFENDTGPDDANHDYDGVIVAGIKGRTLPEPPGGRRTETPMRLTDVAPTVLAALGLPRPEAIRGGPVDPWSARPDINGKQGGS